MKIILQNHYWGETLIDVDRHISECFMDDFNPLMRDIPRDEHGFLKGKFVVTVQWHEEE